MKFSALVFFIATVVLFLTSCSPTNVKTDDSLGVFFAEHQLTGCFALMDNGTGDFTIYNLPRYRDSAFLPASSFELVTALIGLQTGKISTDSAIIPWDGTLYKDTTWNRNLNMNGALRVSALPYFQNLAKRIGKDTLQMWMDSLRYGVGKRDTTFWISTATDSFWLNNTLKITPDENLGFVKKLYFNELPFFKLYQEKVKNAMIVENNANYKLAYSAGWGTTDFNRPLGWVVGWIEENRHPYFFVLNMESANTGLNPGGVGEKLLQEILKKLGFFEGKM